MKNLIHPAKGPVHNVITVERVGGLFERVGGLLKVAHTYETDDKSIILVQSHLEHLHKELGKNKIHIEVCYGSAKQVVKHLKRIKNPKARLALFKFQDIHNTLESMYRSIPQLQKEVGGVSPHLEGIRRTAGRVTTRYFSNR